MLTTAFAEMHIEPSPVFLAPNFDNNQAYLANPGGAYSPAMLNLYMKQADSRDIANLKELNRELIAHPYLKHAYEAGKKYLE